MGDRRGGDQQVDEAGTPCLASHRGDRGEHPTVRAGASIVEWQRFDSCLNPLKALLATCGLGSIARCVRAGRQLGKGEGGNRQLDRKATPID